MVTFGVLAGGACVPDERPGSAAIAGSATALRAAASSKLTSRPLPKPVASLRNITRPSGRVIARRLETPFSDDFDRALLGRSYRLTSPEWRLSDGQLCATGARNHPVWLKFRLPTNVRIEFDAVSHSNAGDLKFELFGDGRSYAKHNSYSNASGYVLIFGGWNNSLHVVARHDEHGADRLQVRTSEANGDPRRQRVVPGQTYHFMVERVDGKTLRWLVDGTELHTLVDKAPLRGQGHEYFGFNNWDARVCFDNLSIEPLEEASVGLR
jgi:hypothetical protein